MSSFWGSQSKEDEKKTPVEKQKKSKTAIAVAEEDKKQEKKQEKKEEAVQEEPKEEEKEDKKTPLFEKKPEVQMQRFGEIPDGVIESTSVQTKIKFTDVETRKFMHLNLDDLLKLDENCAVKIRGIKFSITLEGPHTLWFFNVELVYLVLRLKRLIEVLYAPVSDLRVYEWSICVCEVCRLALELIPVSD